MTSRLLRLATLALLAGCNPGPDSGDDDDAESPIPTATPGPGAEDFVSGAAPACPGPAPVAPSTCLENAAALVSGNCNPQTGVSDATWGSEAPLPAVYVEGTEPDLSCFALMIVEASCGPVAVAYALGGAETSWAGFHSESFGERACWFTSFGRVCAAELPMGTSTIGAGTCSGGGLYIQTADRDLEIEVTSSGVRARNVSPSVSGAGPGSCSCWN